MSERVRKLRAAGSGNSGYRTISRDSEAIMSEAVENFYAVQRYQAFVKAIVSKSENGVCPVCSYLFCECECGVGAAELWGRRFHGVTDGSEQ